MNIWIFCSVFVIYAMIKGLDERVENALGSVTGIITIFLVLYSKSNSIMDFLEKLSEAEETKWFTYMQSRIAVERGVSEERFCEILCTIIKFIEEEY